MAPPRTQTCRCDDPAAGKIRKMCRPCYQRQYYTGGFTKVRRYRPIADTAEDYEFLRSQGANHEAIADYLGLTPSSLSIALSRAKRTRESGA
ncbi:hypothetical protein [Amycolatopsis sp. H20-H5]|uniref:hypothetical protein n=1 Tax=Amycolatopsis sp. H20-H5 TaxID=3046309 RepID=UPI002DBF4DF6|nr:hypothetical protein [Amycolatopsis sp. H20-H5]MEC3977876.1 hypothetical protein [Amycolatopsis sp. H20-H5]